MTQDVPQLLVQSVTIDSHDPLRLATWWADLLGTTVNPESDLDAGEVYLAVRPGVPELLFARNDDVKSAKNRVHLDLRPAATSRDAAVERAVACGAAWIGDFRRADGTGWVAFADPEGNEFCICRSAAERGEVEDFNQPG